MYTINAYTDGSCLGNGGDHAPGGYGSVLILLDETGKEIKRRELSGGIEDTTNNRAELTAVIESLKTATLPCNFVFTTDSQYVIGIASKNWKIKANEDLWKSYFSETKRHGEITFNWVRGHTGHPENERANTLAQVAASKTSINLSKEAI